MNSSPNLLLGGLLGLALLACQTPETVGPDSAGNPAEMPTGTAIDFGKPLGVSVTQTIGPDGGTLTTADGRVAVHFPAGAVKTPTAISLQPVENTAPVEAASPSVALLPADLVLQKPAEVVFKNAKAGRQTGELTGAWIAEQHANGVWEAHTDAASNGTDVVVQVLKMNRFALFYPYVIQKLNQSADGMLVPHEPIKLVVRRNFVSSVGAGKGVILRPVNQTPLSELMVNPDHLQSVRVNGHEFGTARDGLAMVNFNAADGYSLVYTAPGRMPAQAPVEIVAVFDTPEGGVRTARTTVSVGNDNRFEFGGTTVADAVAAGAITPQGISVSLNAEGSNRSVGFSIPEIRTGSYKFERLRTTVSATTTGAFDDIWYQSYSIDGGSNVDNGGTVTITGLEPVKGFPNLVYVRGTVSGRLSKPLPSGPHAYDHGPVKANFALVVPR